jgi:PD-(D/E)XK endonuclease
VRELTPTEKGTIAEAKIHAAATEAGIVVARPLSEGGRYDLIFDTGPRLLRGGGSSSSDSRRLGTASARALQWLRNIALGL